MDSEFGLYTVSGVTDGATDTGNLVLDSSIMYDTLSDGTFLIPFGCKVKVRALRISGDDETKILVQFAYDGTTWRTIDTFILAALGEYDLEKKAPMVFQSIAGTEKLRFRWDQSDAGASDAQFDFEMSITPPAEP